MSRIEILGGKRVYVVLMGRLGNGCFEIGVFAG